MFDVYYTGPKPNLFAFERPAASLEEADALCRTEYFWYINGYNDYRHFDFYWRPPVYEADHTHVWPSQWQDNGGTYLVPRGTKDHKWHWRNSVNDGYVLRATAPEIFYMDFMNLESQPQLESLRKHYPNIKATRYVSDHLNVMKRIVNLATTEYVWVISSICDYKDFDFTWHAKQWQEQMIHCFRSGNQLRGDTFYIHVESFKQQMYMLELLDWFNVINYCEDMSVERFACPKVYYDHDNLVEEIRNYDFKFPYASFSNQQWVNIYTQPCLWTEKDRSVESFTESNAICIVPRDVKAHLRTQIYDYPYVITPKEDKNVYNVYVEEPLDVVYISNGEPDAERWYHHLDDVLSQEETGFPNLRHKNTLRRVDGVNGRMAAYKTAAIKSQTPWFFAVFAKLEVNPKFDWGWKPDYFQEPKHYIFNSRNPVNGLEYGHMGMIAYNKRLVLETEESGLDFTLSKPHEVAPLLSGTAHYNQDVWTTWRTAFREVVKLKHFAATQPNVETDYRLKKWTNVASGNFAEWSLKGAADAVEYYDLVGGEYDKLMLTYEWDWLKQYYDAKY
jgi:hypothetical protein